MTNKPITYILSGILVFAMMGCGTLELTPETRAEFAAENEQELIIGVGWPLTGKNDLFKQGVEMGLAEINGQGGVLGRKLVVDFKDDKGMITDGKLVAQGFAENPDCIAVIGHYNSFISVPAAVIYEYYGLLMLSPGSTSPHLTSQGYERTFRMIPSDVQIGSQLAEFAKKQGYQRMVILYEKSAYGTGLANAFEFRAEDLEIFVPTRMSYDSNLKDYRRILDEIKLIDFDAAFIAGYGADAGLIIKQLREMGIETPFMGGDGLDTSQLWEKDPEAVEGTTVLTVFHPDEPKALVQQFKQEFSDKFGMVPDGWAAQGYDAIRLLADAIKRADSLNPSQIANTLRSTKDWQGVTGNHTFNDSGEVVEKRMVKQVVRNAAFEYLD